MTNEGRDLVLSIYDTIADPSLWPEILDRIAEMTGADGSLIYDLKGQNENRKLVPRYFCSTYEVVNVNNYVENFSSYEIPDQEIFEQCSQKSDAINLLDDSVIEPDIERLKLRENVRLLMQFNLLHRVVGLLDKDNVEINRFSLQYGLEQSRPTSEQLSRIMPLLPHIAKALNLGNPASQLARENVGLFAAMDRLNIGVCILNSEADIVLKNEEFSRQMQDYRVFYQDIHGRLKLYVASEQVLFSSLMKDALVHGKFGARPRKEAISIDEGHFLCIELAPLENAREIGSTPLKGFVLYSTDTSKPVHCDTVPLRRAFGLTETELSLAESISHGLTNAQIAEARGRAVATVNAQVKSILAKTQCSTRTQFVRLMMNFGAEFLINNKNDQENSNSR